MTPDKMKEVGEALIQAMSHVLANTLGETNLRVKEFVLSHVLKHRPWIMTTGAGASELEEIVFSDKEIQDFVLALTYTFGTYWGATPDKYKELSVVLGNSAGIQSEGIVGNQVKERTEVPDRASTRLMANRWLMVLMLVSCFVEISDFEQPATRKK